MDAPLLDEDRSTRSTELWAEIEASSNGQISGYMLLIISLACIGGLLFGYDTGVISGVLVLVGDDLGELLSEFQLELITSITSVGAIAGSWLGGIYGDILGRKAVITVSCIVFVVDSIFMAMAWAFWPLVIGRAIIGIAVGAAATTVPVYIAEIAPAKHRGKLVTLNNISTTGGQVLAYSMGIVFSSVKHGWRHLFALAAIPPVLFLLAVSIIPESPRYAIKRGQLEMAMSSIGKLYPKANDELIHNLVEELYLETKSKGVSSKYSAFVQLYTIPSNFRALVVACGLMASQQLCGFNAFMYYSPTIFKEVGFSNPIHVSIVVSLTNFLFTCIAIWCVDYFGRRRMLLSTVWIMVIALLVTGWSFSKSGILIVYSTIVYVAAYALALGNVPWQAVEFLPLSVRSVGAMMISSTNWISNTLLSQSFLSLLNTIGPANTFALFACFTACSYIGIYFCYPEVKGKQLEEIHKIFQKGFLVNSQTA